jgi:hypothetical protein
MVPPLPGMVPNDGPKRRSRRGASDRLDDIRAGDAELQAVSTPARTIRKPEW